MPPRRKGLPPVGVAEAEDGGEAFDGRNSVADPLAEELERLKALGEVDMLEEARKAAIRLLLAKTNLGTISAAEQAVLRNLLRDNGLVMGLDQPPEPPGANPMGFHLPDLGDDLDEE